ncbi:hypothetical protein [Williamsia sterculiae]|uniref:Uncharacterized protein n=1 Tax=Williamsia sterculiae TaxID=1344003 RepID=A0A1N7HCJ6_9NOCA|nr:hypothetical protein [Williamsia sterculiae]SIS22596.1 hypothetical protein SAMN05445060_3984 [Williamsia sterculiae]
MADHDSADHEKVDRRANSEDDDHPGPADHGGVGGMATREVAPEIAHPDRAEHPDR